MRVHYRLRGFPGNYLRSSIKVKPRLAFSRRVNQTKICIDSMISLHFDHSEK
jgi:hypothetical protein